MSKALCARCGLAWMVDSPLFITCPKCRLYDADPNHGGCKRYGFAGRKRRDEDGDNPSGRDGVRVLEEDQ